MIPMPPAFDTADASWERAIQPIGAWMIGISIPNISVTRFSSMSSLSVVARWGCLSWSRMHVSSVLHREVRLGEVRSHGERFWVRERIVLYPLWSAGSLRIAAAVVSTSSVTGVAVPDKSSTTGPGLLATR